MSNTTEVQIKANRANSQHSTGPRTDEGKRIASHNALKTGLTGRTILLPTEDLSAYEAHLAGVNTRYQPATDEERLYTQNIAHIEWRLLRVPTLESGILAVGRKQFAETHQDEPEEIRQIMIEAEVHLAYQKALANLALQETRLTRQHEREIAKLTALQANRKAHQEKLLQEAAHLYLAYQEEETPFPLKDLAKLGFEFSMDDILRQVATMKGKKQYHWPTLEAAAVLTQLRAA